MYTAGEGEVTCVNIEMRMNDWAAPQIIASEQLYYMDIPPTKWIIDGLLPQGLTILSGDPKIGKSYMAMGISLAVVEGRVIWGRTTLQCNTIYCCLEDTVSRVQKRLHQLTEYPVAGVHYMMNCMPIGSGLQEDLEYALSVVPNVGLIIIDTLQRVRRGAKTTGNAYTDDYEALTVIKQIADKHGVAVVCIHHTRKLKSELDPMADISGTQGLSGTADTLWVLKKMRRFENRATLYVSGRDVEAQKIDMRFERGVWLLDDQTGNDIVPQIIYQVIDYVTEQQSWSGTSSELLQELGIVDVSCSEIGKLLVKYADTILLDAGIGYATVRTKSQRIIKLEYMGDG